MLLRGLCCLGKMFMVFQGFSTDRQFVDLEWCLILVSPAWAGRAAAAWVRGGPREGGWVSTGQSFFGFLGKAGQLGNRKTRPKLFHQFLLEIKKSSDRLLGHVPVLALCGCLGAGACRQALLCCPQPSRSRIFPRNAVLHDPSACVVSTFLS